ncbi:unnamed protein product [Gemmata massiliana]|uniref:Uncharacterized protein n=1 Tax=Gemmata massiliana TaxID=1210884 RepID=A0A6P2CUH7_9BACT|nr:hypothetical protein [Gemmata massiliana]VTR90840.1 unnamed protein product [Gemmata massiliana]
MRCGVCGLLLVVASGCGGSRVAPPSNWTHKNLVEHLEQKGIKAVAELDTRNTTDEAIAAGFYENEVKASSPSVLVVLCRGSSAATEHVNELGAGAFSYGHFAIGPWPKKELREKDAEFLRRIKAATVQGR